MGKANIPMLIKMFIQESLKTTRSMASAGSTMLIRVSITGSGVAGASRARACSSTPTKISTQATGSRERNMERGPMSSMPLA